MPKQTIALVLAVLLSVVLAASSQSSKGGDRKCAAAQKRKDRWGHNHKGRGRLFRPAGRVHQERDAVRLRKKDPLRSSAGPGTAALGRKGINLTGRTIGLVAAVAVGTSRSSRASWRPRSNPAPSSTPGTATQYVFDAEPYGGAIARGLEKDDYSELGHLREAGWSVQAAGNQRS